MDATEDVSKLKFISDEASASDFFGSHEPVADAIATVIRTDYNLKVVGLLGAWGSGKSTVLKILKSKLAASEESQSDTRFFIYDAWVHQSDPPRRSFIETLIEFLVTEKLTTKAEWQADLDKLNRRVEEHDTRTTPTLTLSGKFIAISLLFFPVGLSLINPAWNGESFDPFELGLNIDVITLGILFLCAPALTACIIYYLWRPSRNPIGLKFFRKENWTKHRKPHEQSTIFSVFVNKAIDKVTNTVTRSPDPTAIEFQEAYQKVMTAVSQKNRRFVFVIDNLDRVPETEAVTLWSTVRSFFLSTDNSAVDETKIFSPPVVILPLDPLTVRRMYGNGDPNGDDLAQSFLDKTFDLVFRVAPPVLSDWQSYLEKRLKDAFGDLITAHDIYGIIKLYAAYLTTHLAADKRVQSITPRTIIKFINLIATLKLQHKVDVSLIEIAYYAIHKYRIEKDIRSILESNDPEIAQFESDWRRSIAAIYYNIPREKALQVLMQPVLQAAITNCDSEAFAKLVLVPGFDALLEQIIEQIIPPADPEFITNAAYLIKFSNLSQSPRRDAVRRNLRALVDGPQPWKKMSAIAGQGISALFETCPPSEASRLANSVLKGLENLTPELPVQAEAPKHWAAAAASAVASAKGLAVESETLSVPGDAGFFLLVAGALTDQGVVLKKLRPLAGPDAVIQALSNLAATGNFSAVVEQDVQLLKKIGVSWSWVPLVKTAGQFIQEQPANDTGTSVALKVLGELRSQSKSGAAAELKRLSNDGVLFDKLSQSHEKNQRKAEPSLIAALVMNNPGFEKGTVLGNSEVGYLLAIGLTATLSDRQEIERDIDGQFKAYGEFKDLIDAAQANKSIRPLVQSIFTFRVKNSTIGSLHISDVISRLDLYLGLLGADDQKTFIHTLPGYQTFWDQFAKAPFSENVFRIFTELVDLEDDIGKSSRDDLTRRLASFTSENWESVLRSGTQPLPLVLGLLDRTEFAVDFGEPLSQALHAVVYNAVDGQSFETNLIRSWFRLSNLLDAFARSIFLKGVRDRIVSTTQPGTLQVLMGGGSQLLIEGQFETKGDEAVRNMLNPLLEKPDGINWVVENEGNIAPVIAAAEEETRTYIAAKLDGFSKGSDEAVATAASTLLEKWKLSSLIPPAIVSDDSNGETETDENDGDAQTEKNGKKA